MNGQLILNYTLGTHGNPWAAWRHPESDITRVADFDYYLEQARLAEQGCFDFLFWVDHLGQFPSRDAALFWPHDPMQLMSALAVHTRHIGLIATVGTSFSHPFTSARALASLDHLSRGRAGWNVVTSASDIAAQNYGSGAIDDSARRYKRAREFLDVSLQLWHAWGKDAVRADKANDVLVDTGEIDAINYSGEVFQVRGPLSTPRTPQVVPLIFQAGPSPAGRDLAARYADFVYARYESLEASRLYRDDLRKRAAALGRSPDSIKLLPGLAPFVKSTEAEARRFYREMMEFSLPSEAIALVAEALWVDLDERSLADRMPPEQIVAARAHFSWLDDAALAGWQEKARAFTWGDLARLVEMRQKAEVVVGTPEQVSDRIVAAFSAGAFDGVSISAALVPHSLRDFVEQVVPLLQESGVHKRAYEAGTLRERLGLPRWHDVDRAAWTGFYAA